LVQSNKALNQDAPASGAPVSASLGDKQVSDFVDE
jgi:hypothetical protein